MPAQPALLLRQAAPPGAVEPLLHAALACFSAIETQNAAPGTYRYTPFSTSVSLEALLDFGCSRDILVAPISGLAEHGICRLEHCWVRKRYAPVHAPPQAQPNSWHQDGGLGVQFEKGETPAMTDLVTCWFPLQPCRGDRPALEIVRRPLDRLIHFTELDDAVIRRQFPAGAFWAPELEPGDAILLANGTLHRTYVTPAMRETRLSVEYRLFPATAPLP